MLQKKAVAILSVGAVSVMLGYVFLASCLLGFLTCRYVAGKAAGDRGKVRSIVIPFWRWKIHFHHWLYSLCAIGISSATGIHFLDPTLTYGLLSGLVFQGIYCYGDWHRILVSRN